MDRILHKNAIFAFFTLLIILVYLFLDGGGIFVNSHLLITNSRANVTGSEGFAVLGSMIEVYIARVVYIVLFLFPVVFTSIRFHISFRKNNQKYGFKVLMPYLRLFLGMTLFYYTLTLGTTFPHEVFTNYYSFGLWMQFFRIIAAFLLCTAFIIDWEAFGVSFKNFPNSHPIVFKVIFLITMGICSCMLVEYQAGSKMNMTSNMLFYSVLYWIIFQVFIDLLTRNIKIGAFLSLGLSFLIGLVNDIVYQFRGNYIMYGDLTIVRTALEVAGNYSYKPSLWFWISLGLLISTVLSVVFVKIPRHQSLNLKEIGIRSGTAIALTIGVIVTFNNGMLYNNIFGVGWDYNKNVAINGYLPYFLSNMNSIKRVTLEGYSSDKVEAALSSCSDYESQSSLYPNIIIIQNEAFADLSVLYDIETNQDYMPFIHGMEENTHKGYLNMSIIGGPTANTEFEILTRSTLSFLPYGSVPYTQYINDDLPSAVQVLRNQAVPYHTVAYHPYYSSGYSRTNVYNHFGFDEIVFENNFRDDFPASDLPRDYLSDSADYRRVEQMYEEFRSHSDAPWFCFNVTIQNHGGYTQEYEPSEEERIFVTNFDAPDSLNSYLSLIKTSDDAFRELIEYFSQCDEPTIIAMYGDHQPTLEHEAYEVLADYATAPVNQYYVPYVIWANYDIEESNTLGNNNSDMELNTLSTNYFVSVVFDIAGIELSDYDRYLLDLHERVPAITAIGVWDSEGNYYPSPAVSPFADELSVLEMIQYNLIFDDDNRLTDRFE